MPYSAAALKKQARELIDCLAQPGDGASPQRREWAEQAQALALRAGDLVLEAEVVLGTHLHHRSAVPPSQRLQALRRAGHIFKAHHLGEQALACQICIADALCDAGQEGEALSLLARTLQDGNLHVDLQTRGQLVLAKALLLLGNIDAAVAQLDRTAPLAQAGARQQQAELLYQRALAQLFVLIAKHMPALWYPLAIEPSPTATTPAVAEVLRLLDDAQDLASTDQWAYLAVTRALLRALFLEDRAAVNELARLSIDNLVRDPPLALRATLCLSLVRRSEHRDHDLLPMLDSAEALAEQQGLWALYRSLQLHKSKVYAATGDTRRALEAFQRYSERVVQSLHRHSEFGGVPETGPAQGDAAARQAEAPPGAVSGPAHKPPRAEPAYLRAAARFIDDHAQEPIRVADIARHCGVSRRTLETAFLAFRSSTVADAVAATKMALAAETLRFTNRSIKDVAASVGYRSASAFSREFRRRHGLQPSAWRRSRSSDGGAATSGGDPADPPWSDDTGR